MSNFSNNNARRVERINEKASRFNRNPHLSRWPLLLICISLISCASDPINPSASYNPILDKSLRVEPEGEPNAKGLTATFMGNSTVLISDGTTQLLLDGYVSRYSLSRTLFRKIQSDKCVVGKIYNRYVKKSGVALNAVLVGHTHFDHSLDAGSFVETANLVPSAKIRAQAYGSESLGALLGASPNDLESCESTDFCRANQYKPMTYGEFTVRAIPTAHGSRPVTMQWLIDGPIKNELDQKEKMFSYKVGDVYAFHVKHPLGSILVTTTVGNILQKTGVPKTEVPKTDVVFLATGFMEKEAAKKDYLANFIGSTNPSVVVPIHWDDFTRHLGEPLQPSVFMRRGVEQSMKLLKDYAKNRDTGSDGFTVYAMESFEQLLIDGGAVASLGSDPKFRRSLLECRNEDR